MAIRRKRFTRPAKSFNSRFRSCGGQFVGDPLARPYGAYTSTYADRELRIQTPAIEPGVYAIQASPSMMGPYRDVGRLQVPWGSKELKLSPVPPGYYRVERWRNKRSFGQP